MRPFAQVDVFTVEPGLGNPVAVVLDATGLETEAMQRFAAWTNLSETTFVLPPTGAADYRVRIFTPVHELPFAGHPTIGTCRALIDANVIERAEIVQECAAGLVELTVQDGLISFTAPVANALPDPPGLDALGAAIRIEPRRPILIDSGPHWLTAKVTPTELSAFAPDVDALADLIRTNGWDLTLYAYEDEDEDEANDTEANDTEAEGTCTNDMHADGADGGRSVEVRSFFVTDTLVEDPVCGSGNVAVAAHRRACEGFRGSYRARQGRHRGRDGRITVTVGDRIRVGGHAVTIISGTATI